MFLKRLVDFFVHLLYPDCCLLCGRILGRSKGQFCLCEPCTQKIVLPDEVPTCRICGLPMAAQHGSLCQTCQTHIHDFDRAVSCFIYGGSVRRALLRYKFGHHHELSRPFAALLLARLRPLLQNRQFDAVLCVPLSAESHKKRGYNQSALVAKRVAKSLALPFWENAFTKPHETHTQSLLHYAERLQNVRRAFRLAMPKKAFEGKRFILIDDIITTGATADALCGLLKHAGAAYVLVATIAATELKEPMRAALGNDAADSVIF